MKLNSYTLKWIAIITMLIDHFGYGFRNLLSHPVYILCRSIGRISFPIFCFLLVEGFTYTRSREKYMIRLLIFALISEYPFDMTLHGSFPEFGYQNVFFTLFLGFFAMYLIEKYYMAARYEWIIIIVFGYIAEFCHTDYGFLGVLTILCFYLRRKIPSRTENPLSLLLCLVPLLGFALSNPLPYIFVLLAFFPLSCYNGEKGPGMKYLFYIIYPGHMLLYLLFQHITSLI